MSKSHFNCSNLMMSFYCAKYSFVCGYSARENSRGNRENKDRSFSTVHIKIDIHVNIKIIREAIKILIIDRPPCSYKSISSLDLKNQINKHSGEIVICFDM